jgi:hypothetical protein
MARRNPAAPELGYSCTKWQPKQQAGMNFATKCSQEPQKNEKRLQQQHNYHHLFKP